MSKFLVSATVAMVSFVFCASVTGEAARAEQGNASEENAKLLSAMGAKHFREGNYAAAEQFEAKALEIRLTAFGEQSIEAARSLHNLGEICRKSGKHPESEKYHRRSLAIK